MNYEDRKKNFFQPSSEPTVQSESIRTLSDQLFKLSESVQSEEVQTSSNRISSNPIRNIFLNWMNSCNPKKFKRVQTESVRTLSGTIF